MINKYIDYIDDPKDTYKEYLEKAKKYCFRCVFADLDNFDEAIEYLRDTEIIVAGAIDFPLGELNLKEKMEKFELYAEKGFSEIDYVLNQKAIENKNYDVIEKEMRTVAKFCKEKNIVDKAIVEMCKLDGDETAKEEICKIANKVKPAYLKTSTGRSYYGAKVEDVKLMRRVLLDDIYIKAAGGIHSYEEAKAFIDAGANVLGASAGIEIINGEK
ncbi:deoxyribose-phosphate aldolase [Marinilactibacillus psychrotolerans]|uniref:deoxyribose-phosphate aldolase n=1 Tax=Marinilactibacillus psychrotolerans TaxID=191770 RepID=UPI0039B0D2EB